MFCFLYCLVKIIDIFKRHGPDPAFPHFPQDKNPDNSAILCRGQVTLTFLDYAANLNHNSWRKE